LNIDDARKRRGFFIHIGIKCVNREKQAKGGKMQSLRAVITKIDVGTDPAGVVTKNEISYQAYTPNGSLLVASTETDLVKAGMSSDGLQSAVDGIAYQRWIDYQKNLDRAGQMQSTVNGLTSLVNQDFSVAVPDIPSEPTIIQVNDKITITADGETSTIETTIEDTSQTVADVTQTDKWNDTPIEKVLGEGDFIVTATAVNIRDGRSAFSILNFSFTVPV